MIIIIMLYHDTELGPNDHQQDPQAETYTCGGVRYILERFHIAGTKLKV